MAIPGAKMLLVDGQITQAEYEIIERKAVEASKQIALNENPNYKSEYDAAHTPSVNLG